MAWMEFLHKDCKQAILFAKIVTLCLQSVQTNLFHKRGPYPSFYKVRNASCVAVCLVPLMDKYCREKLLKNITSFSCY